MKQAHFIQGLQAKGLEAKVADGVGDVSIIKITDNIYINAKSDDEVVTELEVYSDTKVSEDLKLQAKHTEDLINTIDSATDLLTDIEDREDLYERLNLYRLGNNKDIYMNNFKFNCVLAEGILKYSIKELS